MSTKQQNWRLAVTMAVGLIGVGAKSLPEPLITAANDGRHPHPWTKRRGRKLKGYQKKR